jgi:putative endonuclease
MYYTYVIQLTTGDYYTGHAHNLQKRIKEHQRSAVFTTKNGKVKELVFYAAFKSKNKALDFEKYLKSSSGFAFRNKRLI